jgi:AraC family transcriptional regulator of adaptative response/methylated-DNA-[protein]-cysteine methyltransferase
MDNLAAHRTLSVPVPPFATDRQRYRALERRDARADGLFLYSVSTTGVYCRPSCGARLALRKNVAFHSSAEDAERAGFRACKRCKPRELSLTARHDELVADMRAQLESSSADKSLGALAARAGMSPFYLQRLFKKRVGMSPREYAAAHRLACLEDELREGSSVTRALYEVGYSSSSRFYEAGSGALGMEPARVRRGGLGVTMRVVVRTSSLGHVLIARTERGVAAITFGSSARELRRELRERFAHAVFEPNDSALDALADQLVCMIDGAGFSETVPLDLIGTAFQQRVWNALRKIPRGETRSYRQVAEAIGAPEAVRAVGTACGKNPVAVAVPCHRVVREGGALGGYRWGLERKQKLLQQEQKK